MEAATRAGAEQMGDDDFVAKLDLSKGQRKTLFKALKDTKAKLKVPLNMWCQ